jgi:hypothetical protein
MIEAILNETQCNLAMQLILIPPVLPCGCPGGTVIEYYGARQG